MKERLSALILQRDANEVANFIDSFEDAFTLTNAINSFGTESDDKTPETPLHIAIRSNDIMIAEVLLNRGADPRILSPLPSPLILAEQLYGPNAGLTQLLSDPQYFKPPIIDILFLIDGSPCSAPCVVEANRQEDQIDDITWERFRKAAEELKLSPIRKREEENR